MSDHYLVIRQLILSLGLFVSYLYFGKKLRFQWNSFDALILAFLLWNFVSILWTQNPWQGLNSIAHLVLGVLVFIYWRSVPKSDNHMIIRWVHIMALAYALITWIGIISCGLEYSFSNKDLYRLQFPAGHKSLIAEYCLLLIPFVLTDRTRWKYITLSLLMAAIIILQSRTALLGLFAMFILYGIQRLSWESTHFKRTLTLILILVVSVFILNQSEVVPNRIKFQNLLTSQTAQERFQIWEKTIKIIAKNAFTGVGAGNWKIHLPAEGLEKDWLQGDRDLIFTRAHNDVLELTSELGLVGGLVWIFILVWIFSRNVLKKKPISRMVSLFVIGFVTISLLDFPKERVEHMCLFWMVMAFGTPFIQKAKGINPNRVSMLLAVISILLFGYFITRYLGERNLVQVYRSRQAQTWSAVVNYAEKAIRLKYLMDPYAMPVNWYAGLGYYQQGEMLSAFNHFQSAYKYHPYQYHVLNNLGSTSFQLGEIDTSIVYYQKCIEVNPHFDEAKLNLAAAFAQKGEYHKALDWLDKLEAKTERSEGMIRQIEEIQAEK